MDRQQMQHYLETQARKDVHVLINQSVGYLRAGHGTWNLGCDGVWKTASFHENVRGKDYPVYYRHNGDCFVVTDLGNGWRALRLRGIDWRTNDEIINKVDAVALPLMSTEPGYETAAPWGTLELRKVAASDLPDAICRVMLASLKIAELLV